MPRPKKRTNVGLKEKPSTHTTIWLHKETVKLLNQQSRKGESYDDILKRVLSGEGEVWVEILSVDNDSPAGHSVLLRLGNYYYNWDGCDFSPVDPRKVKAVVVR